jgi:16S rRNA (cytosine1402-N4)-methyltransferase
MGFERTRADGYFRLSPDVVRWTPFRGAIDNRRGHPWRSEPRPEVAMTAGETPRPPHTPVLMAEVLAHLAPRPSGIYCDATVGYGGHARAILEASAPDGRLVGLDRDPQAIAAAAEALRGFGDRVTLVHAPFSRIASVLERANALPLDGCLVDLGVSSPQLDRAERGFSFRQSGPLDMRMDPTTGETAAQFLGRVSEDELAAVLRDFGEERYAGRIARNIVEARGSDQLSTTSALAALVARSVPRHERHKDPATRTFQALRLAVNGELAELEHFLADAPALVRPGGRLVVIAFHSLEDRLVKTRLRALAKGELPGEPPFRILTKHVVPPSDAERAANPRARSARLRAAERVIV